MVKVVVILGGGIYGATLAKTLESKRPDLQIVLIDKREAFLHKIGSVRATAIGGVWAERILVPYTNLFKKPSNKVVHKVVAKVSDSEVVFEDGDKIAFDHLVVAIGAINQSPGEAPWAYKSRKDMLEYYETTSAKMQAAKKVLIVGGGAVGLELAGELATMYGSEKQITLVHAGPELLSATRPELPSRYKRRVLEEISKLGVKVILNRKIVEPSIPRTATENTILQGQFAVRTNEASDAPIEADTVIFCAGAVPNPTVLPESWIDAKTRLIAVDDFLAVQGTNGKVYAIGDCTNVPEGKFGGLAPMHAAVVAANIGKTPTKKYKANKMTFTILPFGPSKGISYLPFGIMGPWKTSLLKGRTLFSDAVWKDIARPMKVPKPSKNWVAEFRAKVGIVG